QLSSARRHVRARFRRSLAVLKAQATAFRLVGAKPKTVPAPEAELELARREAPTDREHQRILEGVLAALRQLTSGVV
ncbi:MAG: hypothetical protein ABW061_26975, partial [Polyangiaceae bacterium]